MKIYREYEGGKYYLSAVKELPAGATNTFILDIPYSLAGVILQELQQWQDDICRDPGFSL